MMFSFGDIATFGFLDTSLTRDLKAAFFCMSLELSYFNESSKVWFKLERLEVGLKFSVFVSGRSLCSFSYYAPPNWRSRFETCFMMA